MPREGALLHLAERHGGAQPAGARRARGCRPARTRRAPRRVAARAPAGSVRELPAPRPRAAQHAHGGYRRGEEAGRRLRGGGVPGVVRAPARARARPRRGAPHRVPGRVEREAVRLGGAGRSRRPLPQLRERDERVDADGPRLLAEREVELARALDLPAELRGPREPEPATRRHLDEGDASSIACQRASASCTRPARTSASARPSWARRRSSIEVVPAVMRV